MKVLYSLVNQWPGLKKGQRRQDGFDVCSKERLVSSDVQLRPTMSSDVQPEQ